MRITHRPSGFWHVEVLGWKLSIKFGRFRSGFRPIAGSEAWMFGLPFATGNLMRPWKREDVG